MLRSFILFLLLLPGLVFPSGSYLSRPQPRALMPASRFPVVPSFKRSGPVYSEAQLADSNNYQELVKALKVAAHQGVLISANALLQAEKKVEIGGGFELPVELKESFLQFCIAHQNKPVFVFVRRDYLEIVEKLARSSKGNHPVVLLPYTERRGEIEYEFVTEKSRLSFLPHLTAVQFFESLRNAVEASIDYEIYDLDLNVIPSGVRVKKEDKNPFLRQLAAFPKLPSSLKNKIFELSDRKLNLIVAQRNDLAFEEISVLIKEGDPEAWIELVLHQGRVLANKPSITMRLLEKLVQEEEHLDQFLTHLSGGLENNEKQKWFLKFLIRYLDRGGMFKEKVATRVKDQILDNPLIPFWAKALIVKNILTYKNEALKEGRSYSESAIEVAEDKEFWEWYSDNAVGLGDAYSHWVRIVLMGPEFESLRDAEILERIVLHHDMESLQNYALFFDLFYREKFFESLLENYENAVVLVRILNHVVLSNVPDRGKIFELIPEAMRSFELIKPEGVSFMDFVDNHVQWDFSDKSTKKIDPAALLQILVFAEGDRALFDEFKNLYSNYHINHSRDLKNAIANELILANKGFLKQLVIKLLALTHSGFKNRKDRQKHFVKALQLINTIYMLNRVKLDNGEGYDLRRFAKMKILERDFNNVSEYYRVLQQFILDILRAEVSGASEEVFNNFEATNRFRRVLNYLKYKSKWLGVHPQGIEDLKVLLLDYLRGETSIRKIKYGLDPEFEEPRIQMEVYRSVLIENIRKTMARSDVRVENAGVWIEKMAGIVIRSWQSELREYISPFHDNGTLKDPMLVWSTDNLEDWLTLGDEGAYCCLRADNDPNINKALLGRMLSGVCKMKYISREVGVRTSRVHESLNFLETGSGPEVVLNDEQIFSVLSSGSDKRTLQDTIEVAVISAIRNAGRYGATRVIIPDTPGFTGLLEAFLMYEEKLLSGLSTEVDHLDAEGHVLAREKISIESIRKRPDGIRVLGLKERNPWRNWVGHTKVNGVYLPERTTDIVDQNQAKPVTIAGVAAEAVELDFPGIEIVLKREFIRIWDPTAAQKAKIEFPEKVKVLNDSDSGIANLIDQMRAAQVNTGAYLNRMYEASIKLVQFMDADLIPKLRKNELRLIVAIPRGGLPVARALKKYWPKNNRRTGYLHAKKGTIVSKHIPAMQRNRKKTVFVVDEVILSGKSMINSILELKKHGFKEKEMVLMVLGAKQEGLSRVISTFPNLKGVYVGVLEDPYAYDSLLRVASLANGGDFSHPYRWEPEQTVEIGGEEYHLLYRIESKRSYNLFLAQNKQGEEVVVKTVVSHDEARKIRRILSSLSGHDEELNFVSVRYYDPENGSLVTDYVPGKITIGKVSVDENGPFRNKLKFILSFIEEYVKVVRFLVSEELYFVFFDHEHFRWDEAGQKWILTNFNVFSSANDSAKERGEKEFLNHSREFLLRTLYLFFQQSNEDSREWKKELFKILSKLKPRDWPHLEGAIEAVQKKIQERFPIRDFKVLDPAPAEKLQTAV